MVDARALRHRQRVHRARIVFGLRKSSSLQPLGDDDREPPVRREVHVVRVLDRDRLPGLPVRGLIGVSDVAGVVVDLQRLQVLRGRRRAGQRADVRMLDDLERPLADHIDRVALAVRARRRAPGLRAPLGSGRRRRRGRTRSGSARLPGPTCFVVGVRLVRERPPGRARFRSRTSSSDGLAPHPDSASAPDRARQARGRGHRQPGAALRALED